jgi:hypothetical protein
MVCGSAPIVCMHELNPPVNIDTIEETPAGNMVQTLEHSGIHALNALAVKAGHIKHKSVNMVYLTILYVPHADEYSPLRFVAFAAALYAALGATAFNRAAYPLLRAISDNIALSSNASGCDQTSARADFSFPLITVPSSIPETGEMGSATLAADLEIGVTRAGSTALKASAKFVIFIYHLRK